MSTVNINGTLILNGNLTCDGDINVNAPGLIIPVPSAESMGAYYSCPLGDNIRLSGASRVITSLQGNITVDGSINGDGQGFGPDEGPGANSRQESNLGIIKGYGATHGGLGAVIPQPTEIIPDPYPRYGSYQAPVSLGSGSYVTYGGSGIKIEARNGLVTVDGIISMNGESGDTGEDTGGGAGGSIWIITWRLDGTGSITAEGGGTLYAYGGGGGGGYISVWYINTTTASLTFSVEGKDGGTPGKTYFQRMDPVLEERFTGNILNTKWWNIVEPRVQVHNALQMDATTDMQIEPEVLSEFNIQGQNITVDASYIPKDVEPDYYYADFILYADDLNWAGVGRRPERMFAIYSVDGYVSQYAMEESYKDLTLRIDKNDSTFNFQYYDGTSLPITVRSEVLPTLADRKFKIQFRVRRDLSAKGRIVEQLKLTPFNITNQYVSLAGFPIDPENTTLSVIEGSYQFYGLDFYVQGAKLRWDASGLSAYTSPFSYWFIEYHTLTATDLYHEFITLNIDPSLTSLFVVPGNTAVNVVDGPSLELDVDYYVYNERICWNGSPIAHIFHVGDVVRVMYELSPWYNPVPLVDILEAGDVLRIQYEGEDRLDPIAADFDNFRAWDGIITNAETKEPVVYVDPVYGSDSSDGRQLSPLQNLFVATAWSKRGGTVCLYDGTYNSTRIYKKDLTLRGANGSKPVVTSLYVQDSTGENWEDNALSYHSCQGIITNLTLTDSTVGVLIDDAPYAEVRDCNIYNTDTGIDVVNSDPTIMRNEIHDSSVGIDMTRSSDSEIYSNIMYGLSTSVYLGDCSNVRAGFNTVDDCTNGIIFDNSSSGLVVSNNLTNLNTGLIISSDSTPVSSLGNNYFGTGTAIVGTVDSTAGDINSDPLYLDQTGRDYQLNTGSPDIGTGLSSYDDILVDFRGASRAKGAPPEIGAYEYIDGSHTGTDYYVAGRGNDYYSFGSLTDPFRTLDKAMSAADSTIHIDGGHYDSTYLALAGVPLDINPLTVLVGDSSHFVSYLPLTILDIANGYVKLPGFIINADADFDIAINVLDKPVAGQPLTAGPAQEYGTDFVIEFGAIRWAGLGLDGLLDVGDILRIIFIGEFHRDVIDTVHLHSHFSNIDFGQTLFVSPNGSDSTVLGGDGTNTGGDGSQDRPYRTIQKALEMSSPGDHLIVMAGEYPLFDGAANRVIVPAFDKTSIEDKYPRMFLDDFFVPRDFRDYNHIEYDHNWNTNYSGDSSVFIGAGYLDITYDGTNEARADSSFSFMGDYEVTATLRQGIDPIIFSLQSSDSTASVWFRDGDYTASIATFGNTKSCWGHLDIQGGEEEEFFTEYLCVNSDDTRNGFAKLSMIARDCSDSALNIVGGTPQEYGIDYILRGEKVIWGGYGLDGEIIPGDILRIIYKPTGISDPARFKISLNDDIVSIKGYDSTSWHTLNKRVLIPGFDGTWSAAAYMNEATAGKDHTCQKGHGFVSRFLAVSDSFENTDKDRAYMLRTEKRSVVLHEGSVT